MGKITTVICDSCGTDLTTTGNCVDYRLIVGSERKTPWYIAEGERGGFVTAVNIPPPINRTHYFCGLPCLSGWLEPNRERLQGQYANLKKHREWLRENKRGNNASPE